MDIQQAFRIIVTHIRRQGVRSMSEDTGTCAYRGDAGRKCAAGVLIPDSLYNPEIEDVKIGAVLRSCPEIATHLGLGTATPEQREMFVTFLDEMQKAHDSSLAYGMECFLVAAEGIGKSYGLNTDVISVDLSTIDSSDDEPDKVNT